MKTTIEMAREAGLHIPYWAEEEDPKKDPPRWTMVSPLPPLLEAFEALVRADERAAPVQGWMNPNDKTQRKFLPDIGDKVLFCNGGRVYYGHHTGGGFRTGQGAATKYFGTWDCHWMPIPPAHGITLEKGD